MHSSLSNFHSKHSTCYKSYITCVLFSVRSRKALYSGIYASDFSKVSSGRKAGLNSTLRVYPFEYSDTDDIALVTNEYINSNSSLLTLNRVLIFKLLFLALSNFSRCLFFSAIHKVCDWIDRHYVNIGLRVRIDLH